MVWNAQWRAAALPALLAQPWDLLVVGGGISGAGILLEAARAGWRCLLLEQRDFAWGTSSRSSKMVHGGLRYIAQGQLGLTRAAVRERQQMLREAPGLVEPLGFLFPHYRRAFPGPRAFGGLLALYDALAGQRNRAYHDLCRLGYLQPGLQPRELRGASGFVDALTDDARLVMRVLHEARAAGGEALSGIQVRGLLHAPDGRVEGVQLLDRESGLRSELRCRMLVCATGSWAGQLQAPAGTERIRPLRGSHLLLPHWRLPVAQAVSFMHARDARPVFVYPWQGATVVGTTDVDHAEPLDEEARISPAELEYLLAACAQQFPQARIVAGDVLSTWAGVRPVVSTAGSQREPSAEKREHVLWQQPGCLTLAGGKLTTFRLQAREVIKACAASLGEAVPACPAHIFSAPQSVALPAGLAVDQQRRLRGYHGPLLERLVELLAVWGHGCVAHTQVLWAELALACEAEQVLHLDDLLLRRTRLGLLLPEGGRAWLDPIGALCRTCLGWDETRWREEAERYQTLWQQCYSLPAACHDEAEYA